MKLEGHISIVTGVGAGIGKGIALEMAREDADIAVVDIVEEKAKITRGVRPALHSPSGGCHACYRLRSRFLSTINPEGSP